MTSPPSTGLLCRNGPLSNRVNTLQSYTTLTMSFYGWVIILNTLRLLRVLESILSMLPVTIRISLITVMGNYSP